VPLFFARVEGSRGRIVIPFLGDSPVGELGNWVGTRRAPKGEESEFMDVRASVKWVNSAIFSDPDYVSQRKIIVRIGRAGGDYILEPAPGPGQRTVLTGGSLVMDRVRLVKVPNGGTA
jgi:hypothetical protein